MGDITHMCTQGKRGHTHTGAYGLIPSLTVLV